MGEDGHCSVSTPIRQHSNSTNVKKKKKSVTKEPVLSRTPWQEIYATGSVLKRLEVTKRIHRCANPCELPHFRTKSTLFPRPTACLT